MKTSVFVFSQLCLGNAARIFLFSLKRMQFLNKSSTCIKYFEKLNFLNRSLHALFKINEKVSVFIIRKINKKLYGKKFNEDAGKDFFSIIQLLFSR